MGLWDVKMTREFVWDTGVKLIEKMTKDYVIMVRQVQGYVQNDNGYTLDPQRKKVDGDQFLEYLASMQQQLNADIEVYRQTIQQFKDSP